VTVRKPWLVFAGLLVLAPLLWGALRRVQAQEAAWELVRAAATAHRRTGYDGKAHWEGAQPDFPVQVLHDAARGNTRYRWWGFETVEDGPSRRTPDPAAWCVDLDALEESYRAGAVEATQWLGFEARKVTLESRFEGRPRIELTVEAATSLPLRVVWYRPDGEVSRIAAFTELRIGRRNVQATYLPGWPDWLGERVEPESVEQVAGFSLLEPAYLPAGFRLIDCRVKEWAGTKVRFVYSDGATVFELSQGLILTPAQMEAALEQRVGPGRAQWEMRWIRWRGRRAIVESREGEEGVVARRRSFGPFVTYDLRVEDREVTLMARSDLAAPEVESVLRSLRPAR